MNKRIIVVVTAALLSCFNSFATHIVGGELNYICKGNNTYEIHLRVYRDCNPGNAAFDANAAIGIFDVNNNLLQTLSIPKPPVVKLPYSVAQADVCVKYPSNVCVELAEYITTVVLPPRVGGYQLAYQRCCRNVTISNLNNPGSTGSTYYATIPDQTIASCNSNPVFWTWPPLFVCANSPISYDHSAIDKEGDSIAYTLCTPFTGATGSQSMPKPPNSPPYSSVTYRSGYSSSNPLGGSFPLTIDPVTGQLTGTPSTIGQFVVGICAEEYRNGVLISVTKRDFQFNVINCVPDITVSAPLAKVNCGSKKVIFTNQSTGGSSYFWDFGDLTVTNDTSNVTNPSYTYPAYGTYNVTLLAKSGVDTSCNKSKTFAITVDTCGQCPMSLTTTKTDGTCSAGSTGCTPVSPVLDTKSGKTIGAGVPPADSTTISWNHTVTTGGLDRLLVVQVSSSGLYPTSVSFGSTALTLLSQNTTNSSSKAKYVQMWYMIAPPIGTNLVVVKFPTGSGTIYPEKRGESFSFTGVNQTTPFNTVVTSKGQGCVSYSVPSNDKELVLDMIAKDYFYALSVPSTSVGQVKQYDFKFNFDLACGGSTKPGVSPTTTMMWDWQYCSNTTTQNNWVALGVAIKPTCTATSICTHYKWTHPCGNYQFENYGDAGSASGSCNGFGGIGSSGINVTSMPTVIVGTDTLPKVGMTAEIITTDGTAIGACKGANISINTAADSLIFDFYVYKTTYSSGGGVTNGSATVTPVSGVPTYTYLWSSTPSQTGSSATNLTAGSYTVTVDDGGGCQKTASVQIDANSSIVLAVNQTAPTSCGVNDATASVTPSGSTGPYAYSWSNGQTGATATGLAPGTYTVVVYEGICSKSTIVTVPPFTTLSSTATATPTKCKGASNGTVIASTPSNGTAPYTYVWGTNPAQLNDTATGLASGYYIVTITDSNGCLGTAAATVVDSSITVSSASSNISCFGDSTGTATITITGGTPNYTYVWNSNPVQNTAVANNLPAGTYMGYVIDSTGCSDSIEVTLTEPNYLHPEPTNTSQINCAGATTGSAHVDVSGGVSPFTYSWCNGQTSADVTGLSAGDCFIQVTDANGCFATDTITITLPAPLALSLISTDLKCFGDSSGAVSASISGGVPGYTYSWSSTPSQTTSTAVNLPIGTYTVTVTDAQSCTQASSVVITEPVAMSASASTTGCNITDGIVSATVSGGNTPYTYSWCNGQTSATATNLTNGTCYYQIVDSLGCIKNDSVVINLPNQLTSTPSVSTMLCNDDSTATITLSTSGGNTAYTYLWSTTLAQTSSIATNLKAGTYIVTITDAKNCTATTTATVTEPTAISIQKNSVSASCNTNDGQASVTVNGGTPTYTYLWNTSPVQSTDALTNLVPGIYVALVTDANGCADTVNVTVGGQVSVVEAKDTVSFVLTCNEGILATFTNNSTGATSWLWNFGDGTTSTLKDPTHTFNFGQTVTVKLIAYDGTCTDTVNTILSFKNFTDYLNLKLPNVFTPNNDGVNDCFQAQVGNSLESCLELIVFDRWGLKMFEGDKGVCWNGKTSGGKDVPEGTYYYIVKVVGTDSPEFNKAGFVQVLR